MPRKSKAQSASIRNLLSHSETPSAPIVAKFSIHDASDTSTKPPTTPCGQSHTQEIHAPFDPNFIEIIGRFDDLENDFPDLYQLEEFIASRGHICDFYPKYHCELNFIEQYWGAAKVQYRNSARTAKIDEMERNVLSCLNDVPLLQIRQ